MAHRYWKLSAMLVSLLVLLATGAVGQNADLSSKKLQIIFDSAMIDFRDYRSAGGAVPDLSTSLAKVTCQMNTWANNVPMYVCYAQTALAGGDSWFRSIIDGANKPPWLMRAIQASTLPVTDCMNLRRATLAT